MHFLIACNYLPSSAPWADVRSTNTHNNTLICRSCKTKIFSYELFKVLRNLKLKKIMHMFKYQK